MSETFLILDHRIGRHTEKVSECPVCMGEKESTELSPPKRPTEDRWYNFVGAVTPPWLPLWGDIWAQTKMMFSSREDPLLSPHDPRIEAIKIFVKDDPNPDEKAASGIWVPFDLDMTALGKENGSRAIHPTIGMTGMIQTEIGKGTWNSRVRTLAVKQAIPEAGTDPIGVDLVKWATEKNRAELLVMMIRRGLWPVSSSITDMTEDYMTRQRMVTERVRAVQIIQPFWKV